LTETKKYFSCTSCGEPPQFRSGSSRIGVRNQDDRDIGFSCLGIIPPQFRGKLGWMPAEALRAK
jgi:hypothetical protein